MSSDISLDEEHDGMFNHRECPLHPNFIRAVRGPFTSKEHPFCSFREGKAHFNGSILVLTYLMIQNTPCTRTEHQFVLCLIVKFLTTKEYFRNSDKTKID